MLLIPAIDLRHGRCVRLHQGDFGAETRYEHEPHELLLRYRSLGASWLHVVDLDGAKVGVLANRAVIVALASQRAVRLQVGGGVRFAAVIDDLLRQGVERVAGGSAAVEQPGDAAGWLARLGVAPAVTGKGLLEERITPEGRRPYLPDASWPAWTCARAGS